MTDPRLAHLVDARVLLAHLPRSSQSDLFEIRRAFGNYLATRDGRRHGTWQEAWNGFTGAAPQRPGEVRFHVARCPDCHGRGFDHRRVSRNLARTGQPFACGTCRGTGRGQWVTHVATFIAPPTEPDHATQGGPR